jgi:hypothetical protein
VGRSHQQQLMCGQQAVLQHWSGGGRNRQQHNPLRVLMCSDFDTKLKSNRRLNLLVS